MRKTAWQEASLEMACSNSAAGFPQRNVEVLIGEGNYEGIQQQIIYDPGVYAQIAAAATKA